MNRPPRTYTIDAPPAWLAATEQALKAEPDLSWWQLAAARQLLRSLELDFIDAPHIELAKVCNRQVASLQWICGRRVIMARPVQLAGRLHVHVTFWRDGGDPVWSGWPREPVAFCRGAMGWVFQGINA